MDKEQFTQQVLAAEQTLYRVAKSMLMNEADCEDAVQDAVIAAYTHLERLQNPAYFKTWLIRILINGCKKRLRQAKRTCALEEWMPLEQNTVLSDLEVQMAVEGLPSKIRLTVVLYYVEGYSVQKIGTMLKIPTGTVKSRLSKARKALEMELEVRNVYEMG